MKVNKDFRVALRKKQEQQWVYPFFKLFYLYKSKDSRG